LGYVSHAELGMVTLKYVVRNDFHIPSMTGPRLVKKNEHFKCSVKRDEERGGI
jgi:hypothetical protein